MKKLFCIVMVMIMAFGLTSCLNSSDNDSVDPTPTQAPSDNNNGSTDGGDYTYEELTLDFSNSSSPESLTGVSFDMMKDYIEEATDGNVKMNLHWQGSLFPQEQDLPACIKGSVDMISTQPAYISEYLPEIDFITSAYLFESPEHWQAFYQSEEWNELVEKIAEEVGVRVIGVESVGTRTVNLRTDKEILSRADLANTKLRLQNSPAWLFLGEALGGNPTPISYSDLYLSLQTGAVDGSEVTLISIKDKSLYEVLKSVTMTKHIYETNWNVINEDLWQSLSPEMQQVIQEGMDIETQNIINTGKENTQELIDLCEANGMTVYQPTTEELESYRQEVLDYYAENLDTSNWDMDLYQKIQDLAPSKN